MTDTIFSLQDVSFYYNQAVTALNGISLDIQRGERIAILGANGSGKSTLLRILDGLYFPDSGSVSYAGRPLNEERLQDEEFAFQFRRQVALVFQNPDIQLFNASVFDEVAFGPLQLRWPRDEIRRRVYETLDLLEISHLKDRSPQRLSGGEKKRVALASVLVLDPAVLLLDEPTAALDPKSQSQVIDLLVSWRGSKTVITATHDLDSVEEIADRCYVFQNGRLIAEGLPASILRDEPLLRSSQLIHAHRHGGEERHTHHHRHAGGHGHAHERNVRLLP